MLSPFCIVLPEIQRRKKIAKYSLRDERVHPLT